MIYEKKLSLTNSLCINTILVNGDVYSLPLNGSKYTTKITSVLVGWNLEPDYHHELSIDIAVLFTY